MKIMNIYVNITWTAVIIKRVNIRLSGTNN